MINKIQKVELSGEASPRRISPRREEDKQSNYDDLFDATTLFADVYLAGTELVMVGPPLLNLADGLEASRFEYRGEDITERITIRNLDRLVEIRAEVGGLAGNLSIVGPLGVWTVNIGHEDFPPLNGANILLTQQRDNDIEWILYWVMWHVQNHAVDVVVIYDNGSSLYSLDELEAACLNVPGVRHCLIIDWQVPFGVTGGPNQKWDSDYGQHEFLHHARTKYLNKSRAVLCCDIDELVQVLGEGDGIFDQIVASPSGVLSFSRLQVLQIPRPGLEDSRLRVHSLYGYVAESRALLNAKYGWNPAVLAEEAQLMVHRVANVDYPCADVNQVVGWHFGGIRKDWRSGSATPVSNMSTWPSPVQLETELVQVFDAIETIWEKVERRVSKWVPRSD